MSYGDTDIGQNALAVSTSAFLPISHDSLYNVLSFIRIVFIDVSRLCYGLS